MKISIFLFFTLLAVLINLQATRSLWSQNRNSLLTLSPKKITESFTIIHPNCPDKAVQKTSISYPQWTGSPEMDNELKKLSEIWLDTARSSAMDIVSLDRAPCSRTPEYFNEISYEMFRPSEAYAGLLFTDLGYNGGVHGYRIFQAYNFNLETGKLLELTDLFPNPEQSLEAFFSIIYKDSCSEDSNHLTTPHFYGGVPCQAENGTVPAPPREFLVKVDSLENLGNIVFTPEGATVNIGPHSAWSWAEGPYVLRIPKAELIKIGANPAIWGQ